MKIHVDQKLVELTPETESETEELLALWNVVVDCVKFNKKLVPVGEFVPGKQDELVARFHIEG